MGGRERGDDERGGRPLVFGRPVAIVFCFVVVVVVVVVSPETFPLAKSAANGKRPSDRVWRPLLIGRRRRRRQRPRTTESSSQKKTKKNSVTKTR